MPADGEIREQLHIVRQLLTQTQVGKVQWEPSGDPDAFRSVRSRAVVLLDRVGRPARVRLRFSQAGHRDYDTVIEQVLSDAQPFPEEQELDAFLSVLYQFVSSKSARSLSAAELFLEEE